MKNTKNIPPPFTGNHPAQAPPNDTNTEEQVAFCVKCKTKHPMINPSETKLKNGRDALKGNCKNCNTTVFKLTSKKKEEVL